MRWGLDAVVVELGQVVVGEPLGSVLRRVADLAVALVPGAADVSVTLVRRNGPALVAFHGGLAADLDERQYPEGFGPATAAARTGRTVCVDTATGGTFPAFSAVARRRGVHGVVSVALPDPDRCRACLTAYCSGSRDVGVAQHALERFSACAAVVLSTAEALAEARERADNLQTALQSRAVIEQAKGVLMARRGVDAEAAFDLLATWSQNANRKLRAVALDVVEDAVSPSRGRSPSS